MWVLSILLVCLHVVASKVRVAVVLENVKEGYAEPNLADYVTLIASELQLPITLSIIGTAKAPQGQRWLSDPEHVMLNRFKSSLALDKTDFISQTLHSDGQYFDFQGTFRGNVSKDRKNITSEIKEGVQTVHDVFGYNTSILSLPRIKYHGRHSIQLPSPWNLTGKKGSNSTELEELVLSVAKDNGIKALSFDFDPRHKFNSSDLSFLPVTVRTNGNFYERDKNCGVSALGLSDIETKLSKSGEFVTLVISPQDIAGHTLMGDMCGGRGKAEYARMKKWFEQLKKQTIPETNGELQYEFVRLCEINQAQLCEKWTGIPKYPSDWKMILIQGIRYISFGFIGFSVIATLCNYAIFLSAMNWAGCRCRKKPSEVAKKSCFSGVLIICFFLLLYNVVMIYLLCFFVFNQYQGFSHMRMFQPLDYVGGPDTVFQLWGFIMVIPTFLLILGSLISLHKWKKWGRHDGDWQRRVENCGRVEEPNLTVDEESSDGDDSQELPVVTVFVPVYQESVEAFMRMVQSATHQTYSKTHPRLVELFIVFDGLVKNGVALKKTVKCKKAIDLYLGNKKSDPRQKYYCLPDPLTGVKVHVFAPEWGGKWSAQRNGWGRMQDVYRDYTQKPHILFIDSDCVIKEDAVDHLARCMSEQRACGQFEALAGHVKVEMKGDYNFWWKLQEADFIISQMMVRGAEELLGGVTCLPGAFCMMRWSAFDREADEYFREVDKDNYWEYSMVHVAEDRFLTLLLLLHAERNAIGYCPMAEVTTECPGDLITLITQRRRWYLSAMVNDIPMVLRADMWKKYTTLMFMRVYFLISSCAPANSFQVGILGIVSLSLRSRSPDSMLLYLTIIPAYCAMILYSIIARRRGPILYFFVFQLFMPIFSMYVAMKAFRAWLTDDRGWGGPRDAGGAAVQPAVEGAVPAEHAPDSTTAPLMDDAPQHIAGNDTPPLANVPVGSMGFRGSLSRPGSLAQKTSLMALDFTLHSLQYGASFRDPDPRQLPETQEEMAANQINLEEDVRRCRVSPYVYEKAEPEVLRDSPQVGGMNFVRFLAAIYIVAFHYLRKSDDYDPAVMGYAPFIKDNVWYTYWISWGGQWVQFFWVSGGFFMTYSRLLRNSSQHETVFQVWRSSIVRIYPAYVISIFLTLYQNSGALLSTYKSIPTSLLMVFSWGWNMYCRAPHEKVGQYINTTEDWTTYNEYICVGGINEPAWYICTLQFYWFLFPVVYRWVQRKSIARVTGAMLFLWACTLIWPLLLAVPGIAKHYQWGGPLATVQAYNPISHWYKFFFGMCLARVFVELFCRPKPGAPNGRLYISETQINRVSEAFLFAPIGWVSLFALFFVGQYDEFQLKLIWRPLSAQEFVLVPIFSLIIIGSALRRDWITKALTSWPLNWFEKNDFSYEIYILQGGVNYALQWVFNFALPLQCPPADPNHYPIDPHQSDCTDEIPMKVGLLIRWLYIPILCLFAYAVQRFITNPIANEFSGKSRSSAPTPKAVTPKPAVEPTLEEARAVVHAPAST